MILAAFAGFVSALLPAALAAPSVAEIVQRSMDNNTASWSAFPGYSYTQHATVTKGGHKTVTTYQVLMIDGSPYNKTIEMNNEPVPVEQQERKLQAEIDRRHRESPDQRQERIAKYQRERQQDHSLIREMVNAFDFKLVGTEVVNGRNCYVLEASPRPGYRPINRDTKVLTGMRGKMWVAEDGFHWVKVHAEVFRPVSFGLFIAKVRPGTEFLLEMTPVSGDLWLPTHFVVHVKANVLFWSRESLDDEYYSDYSPVSGAIRASAH